MKWLFIFFMAAVSFADEGHKHDEHEQEEAHQHGDEHGEEHGHEAKDPHEHDDESSAVVGANKGILAKGENGFQLSPEAIKSFALKYQASSAVGFDVPATSLVEIRNERFLYRVREGWIQKVPVQVLRKIGTTVTVQISGFKAGDQVIVAGAGFVRTAEMVAEEGVSHGHSH